ncbi:MAG: hypothetical protein G3M70_11290 [Candidatus Nitronauta litoralis]|uniref:Uncharacterized protein n=1 Tax=Candidatus Nitronauta litoralis TaxID=2705533 RepID=A0A7T0BXQ6_9BACT|nr:MAG: hypothetical protein G3M70_11290 [Candidatus Nitronauta litoralis]
MKNTLTIICLSLVLFPACVENYGYETFADPDNKGEILFAKHWKTCRTYTSQLMKPSEGSEGAGELRDRKQRLFLRCMEKEGWRLNP